MPTQVRRFTAAQQAQVQKILLDSVKHYQSLLDYGKTVLGTTAYPDGPSAIQAAIDDSNSPAARFARWRRLTQAEHDMSYGDAYAKAEAFYSDAPQREPAAIFSWRQDMDTVQSSLYEWVLDAYARQIGSKSLAEFTASEQKLQDALRRATQDAMAIHLGS